jgi:hypothetical protein
MKLVREELEKSLSHFMFWGLCIFSCKKLAEVPTLKAKLEEVEYQIEFSWV